MTPAAICRVVPIAQLREMRRAVLACAVRPGRCWRRISPPPPRRGKYRPHLVTLRHPPSCPVRAVAAGACGGPEGPAADRSRDRSRRHRKSSWRTPRQPNQSDRCRPFRHAPPQTARMIRAGQREPCALKDVRPPADGGTGVPWVAAFDHLIRIIKPSRRILMRIIHGFGTGDAASVGNPRDLIPLLPR